MTKKQASVHSFLTSTTVGRFSTFFYFAK